MQNVEIALLPECAKLSKVIKKYETTPHMPAHFEQTNILFNTYALNSIQI